MFMTLDCGEKYSPPFLIFRNLPVRLFDAAIYFWMPQINVFVLRLIQGRNLRHRMVGRTVVIGDIPWVAQSAEAFLSKVSSCAMMFPRCRF